MFIYTSFGTYEWKLSFLVLCFKMLYIHLPCTIDRGGASILSPGNMSVKESLYQTVNMEEKTSCQVKVCTKIISVPIGG